MNNTGTPRRSSSDGLSPSPTLSGRSHCTTCRTSNLGVAFDCTRTRGDSGDTSHYARQTGSLPRGNPTCHTNSRGNVPGKTPNEVTHHHAGVCTAPISDRTPRFAVACTVQPPPQSLIATDSTQTPASARRPCHINIVQCREYQQQNLHTSDQGQSSDPCTHTHTHTHEEGRVHGYKRSACHAVSTAGDVRTREQREPPAQHAAHLLQRGR